MGDGTKFWQKDNSSLIRRRSILLDIRRGPVAVLDAAAAAAGAEKLYAPSKPMIDMIVQITARIAESLLEYL